MNGGKHQDGYAAHEGEAGLYGLHAGLVAEKAKVLVDIIHKHGAGLRRISGDDSWVGMEPRGTVPVRWL